MGRTADSMTDSVSKQGVDRVVPLFACVLWFVRWSGIILLYLGPIWFLVAFCTFLFLESHYYYPSEERGSCDN